MIIILLFIIVVILLYIYGTRNHGYWKKKGVIQDPPMPFFGNAFRLLFLKTSISDMFKDMYRKYPNEKYVGFYVGNRRALLLRDPEMVKRFLVTDFKYFYHKGLSTDGVLEPMLKNLFAADGDNWKLMRQKLSAAFTTGKLKAMIPIIIEKTDTLKAIAGTAVNQEIDVRDLITRYMIDFVVASLFGVEPNSLKDPTTMFREIGVRTFDLNFRDFLAGMLRPVIPHIFRHMHIVDPKISKKFHDIFEKMVEQRDRTSGPNDFLDILIDMKERGKIIGDSIEVRKSDGSAERLEFKVDNTLLAAQVLVFFAAGYETSASAASFTLHQLAFHPEEQKKCQEEIEEVLSRHGQLTYDALKELQYLEMCFKEAMRIYPSIGHFTRRSAMKYNIPGTDVIIDENVLIGVSLEGLQNDEQYFDEPDKFKPERFHPDRVKVMKKYVYMPFGTGPRVCIGERMGVMESLAAIAALLSQYSMVPSKNTLRHPINNSKAVIVQNFKGGLPLKIVPKD